MTDPISVGLPQERGVNTGFFAGLFFAVWLLIVLVLGAEGAFSGREGQPPLPLLMALVAPLALFLVGYRYVPAIRGFALSADPRVIVAIQSWRWAGFGFLTLSTYRILPAVFTWPAGLGDMAIGVTAPLVLIALLRDAKYAASNKFVLWNLAGILDLFTAVSIAAVLPLFAPGLLGGVSTIPMTQLPLVLIPAYFVPGFLILHLTALLQVRHKRRAALHSAGTRQLLDS